jgi:hypothetical protein
MFPTISPPLILTIYRTPVFLRVYADDLLPTFTRGTIVKGEEILITKPPSPSLFRTECRKRKSKFLSTDDGRKFLEERDFLI